MATAYICYFCVQVVWYLRSSYQLCKDALFSCRTTSRTTAPHVPKHENQHGTGKFGCFRPQRQHNSHRIFATVAVQRCIVMQSVARRQIQAHVRQERVRMQCGGWSGLWSGEHTFGGGWCLDTQRYSVLMSNTLGKQSQLKLKGRVWAVVADVQTHTTNESVCCLNFFLSCQQLTETTARAKRSLDQKQLVTPCRFSISLVIKTVLQCDQFCWKYSIHYKNSRVNMWRSQTKILGG